MKSDSASAPGAASKARRVALVLATLGGVLAGAQTATAQPSAPREAPPEASAAAASGVAEPVIRRTVIDDKGTRIEELRVRGQLQSVTVTPKGAPAYEVITNNDGRDLPAEGKTNTRGAAGKRVWSVLRF